MKLRVSMRLGEVSLGLWKSLQPFPVIFANYKYRRSFDYHFA